MADENLSFAIVFEEANRLVNGVKEASDALEGLKGAAATAASGLEDAARSAISGADAFSSVGQAAAGARDALADISGAVDLAVDSGPLLETAAAAEEAAAAVDAVAESASSAKSEAELAAEAMSALGFETKEEEVAARAAADALDALAGNVGNVASASEDAASGIGGLADRFGTLGTVAKAAIAGFAGLAALRGAEEIGRGIAGSLRGAVEEFIEAERAATALDAALQSTGKFSSQATSAIREFAAEIAKTTTFTDDAVISAAALIAQVGQLGGPTLVRATEAAVQLSAVLGRDLSQTALLLARGAAGATEAFSRFGIVVKGAGTDAEKFDQILGQISQKFAGRAQADARTFGGSIDQLKNSWREFLETVGGTVTVFQPILSTLTKALQKANSLLGEGLVTSSLDAREALKGVSAGFQDVLDTVTHSNLRKLLAQSAEGSTVGDVIAASVEKGVKRAEAAAAKAVIAVKATVEGGDLDEIADVTHDIAALRRFAQETGNAELRSIVQELEFTLAAAKDAKIKIELEGGKQAIQGLQQVTDLVSKLQTLGGAREIEVLDTASLLKGATDVGKVANQVESAADAIITSMDKISTSGKVDGSALVQGFQAIEDAKQSLIEKFGKLAPELEAAFSDAQDRLRTAARKLDVKIELNLVGGFGQSALDALIAGFDRAEAETKAFAAVIRSTLEQAGADPSELIRVDKLIAKVHSIEELVPIARNAMQNLQGALLGGEIPGIIDEDQAAKALALFVQLNQAVNDLEQNFGEITPAARAAFDETLKGLEDLVGAFGPVEKAVNSTFDSIEARANQVGQNISSDMIGSFQSIMRATANFSEAMKMLFADLVSTILKELIKIFVVDEIISFVEGIVRFGGGAPSLPSKVDIPELPPAPTLEIPVEVAEFQVPPPPSVPPVVIEVPAVPQILIPVAIEKPILEQPEALQVPITFEVPPLPIIVLPAIPDIAAIVVPVDFKMSELPEIATPEVDPAQIQVEVGAIPAIDVPEVEAIQVAVTVQDVAAIPTPEVGTVSIPVEVQDVPAIEAPQVSAVQIAVEAQEVPDIQAPEVEAVQIAVALQDIPDLQLPDVEAIEIAVNVQDVPDIETPEVDAVQIPILLDAIPAIEVPEVGAVQIAVEAPTIPEIEPPAVDPIEIAVMVGQVPDIEVPSVEAVAIAVAVQDVPDIGTPEVDAVQIAVEMEEIPAIQVPAVEAVTIAVDMEDVPAIETPEVDAVQIAIDMQEIPDLQLPEVEAIEVAVGVQDVPSIEPPEVDAVEIAVEVQDVPDLQLPEVEAIQVAVSLQDVPAIETPEVDAVQIPVAMDQIPAVEVPEADAVTVAVELQKVPTVELDDVEIEAFVKAPEIPRLDAIEIPVEFLRRDVPTFDFPSVSVPVEFERPEFPRLESVPASLEFARRQATPREETVPASLEFSRIIQAQAVAESRLRREQRQDRLRPIEPGQTTNIRIEATDGVSVRRQFTSGAMRREIERSLRRSGI